MPKNQKGGFCLTEVVWGSCCGAILISIFLLLLLQVYKNYDTVLAHIEVEYNGRFAKQVVSSRIRYALEEPVITDKGDGLDTGRGTDIHFRFRYKQLYRRLSNGALQPYTGTSLRGYRSRITLTPLPDKKVFTKAGAHLYRFSCQVSDSTGGKYPINTSTVSYFSYFKNILNRL